MVKVNLCDACLTENHEAVICGWKTGFTGLSKLDLCSRHIAEKEIFLATRETQFELQGEAIAVVDTRVRGDVEAWKKAKAANKRPRRRARSG